MSRGELDALIEERIRYTISYANEKSPFYRSWFREHGINPSEICTHEDLKDIFTLHETSGTSGTPKAFFFTREDWQRYAEKYARIFTSQGFSAGDRVVVCASYGMNMGANTMTLAARDMGMTIIPEGKCTFPSRVIKNYKPTGIVGSVFKLLGLS